MWQLLMPAIVLSAVAGCTVEPWQQSLALANSQRTLERAHASIGLGTAYQLGTAGFDPAAPLTPACDCSGFIAWCIGVPRELPPNSNLWLQTDTFWAGGLPVGPELFQPVMPGVVQVGDLIVYPDGPWGQGHIGLVSAVQNGEIRRVIHCSSRNWRDFGDAILETEPAAWQNAEKEPRVIRVDYVRLRRQFGLPEAADNR